jgi:hypothetical protein
LFDAIHKLTLEKTGDEHTSGYYADEIWSKFPDPHKEQWLCCPICLKSVVPVIHHNRNINGEEVGVLSHFRMKDENMGECVHGESDKHKRLKILVATLVENKKIVLKTGAANILYSDLDIKDVARPSFRWEQTLENRRADVQFNFNNWHHPLGQGIVFEIQISSISTEDKKARENDWISRGYSVAWLKENDFSEDALLKDKILIDYPFDLSIFGLNKVVLNTVNTIKQEIEKETEEIKKEIENFKNSMKRDGEFFVNSIGTLNEVKSDLRLQRVIFAAETKEILENIGIFGTQTQASIKKMIDESYTNTCRNCLHGKTEMIAWKETGGYYCLWNTISCVDPLGCNPNNTVPLRHEAFDACEKYRHKYLLDILPSVSTKRG